MILITSRLGDWTAGAALKLTAGERWLHRLEGREETDLASGQLRSELCARLTEELAGDVERFRVCDLETGT